MNAAIANRLAKTGKRRHGRPSFLLLLHFSSLSFLSFLLLSCDPGTNPSSTMHGKAKYK